jgi:dihydroorotase
MERIEEKCAIANRDSLANYAFFLGASNENLEDVKSAETSKIAGIKVFMGSSTGNMLVDEEKVLEGIFRNAPTIIATHCEDTPTIINNEEIARRSLYQILLDGGRTCQAGKCKITCAPYYHGGGIKTFYSWQ